jgi:hypothetical protein
VVAQTGFELTSIGQGVSINDSGYVAFMAESRNDSGQLADNVYAFSPTVGEYQQLMHRQYMYPKTGADALTPGTQKMSGEVQINNNNDVLAWRRLNAQVLQIFGLSTAPLTYYETWSAEVPAAFGPSHQVAMAYPNGISLLSLFINPPTAPFLPSPLDPSSPYEGLFENATLDNHGRVNLSAIARGAGNSRVSTNTGAARVGFGGIGNLVIQPWLADNGYYVFTTNDERVFVERWDFGAGLQLLAGSSNGFSDVGEAGISDDGNLVVFAGRHTQDGEGIYAALFNTASNRYENPRKVFGTATRGNGVLEFGETLEFDGNRLVDGSGFTDFDLTEHTAVNKLLGSDSDYIFAFKGTRDSLGLGLHTAVVTLNPSNPASIEPREPLTLVSIGDLLPEIPGTVSNIRVHDAVNQLGELAVWIATTGGGSAVVRATRPDSIDRWWATVGDNPIDVNFKVLIPSAGNWSLDIEIDGFNPDDWEVVRTDVTVSGPVSGTHAVNFLNEADLGTLVPGYYNIRIQFAVPDDAVVEPVRFLLSGPTTKIFDALFVADHREPDFSGLNSIDIVLADQQTFSIASTQDLIELFRPVLHFDNGHDTLSGPERFQMPFDVRDTYKLAVSGISSPPTGDRTEEFTLSPFDPPYGTLSSPGPVFTPDNFPAFGGSRPVIYAAVVEKPDAFPREIAINYYFHYPLSNWHEHGGNNTHGGDWEGVTVFLQAIGSNLFAPDLIAYAQHAEIAGTIFDHPQADGGDTIAWDRAILSDSTRPNVFVGLGGHASYPFPGQTAWRRSLLSTTTEYHRGNESTFDPMPDQVEYLPRVGTKRVADWQLYPGLWGRTNDGTPTRDSDGDDAPLGPVFIDPFAEVFCLLCNEQPDYGQRWLRPWAWANDLSPADNPLPQLSIDDIEVVEGTEASTAAAFTVTISSDPSEVVTVRFDTSDGTATTADSDYTARNNVLLTFSPGGPLMQIVTVNVRGDAKFEPNQVFFANLSAATGGAAISDAQGVATIADDDLPIFSIDHAPPTQEGRSGVGTNVPFVVRLSNPSDEILSVQVDTIDGTATDEDDDYEAIAGTIVTFNPGELSKPVVVKVNGDDKFEADQTFFVEISAPSQGIINAGAGRGAGTIVNDDNRPAISVGPAAAVTEGASGTSANLTFQVGLSNPSDETVSVRVDTADGTATAGDDYLPIAARVLVFQPDQPLVQTVAVIVRGDNTVEPNETFAVLLADPTAASIGGGTAVGTIVNDDVAVVQPLRISAITFHNGDVQRSNIEHVAVTFSHASNLPTLIANGGIATAVRLSGPGAPVLTASRYQYDSATRVLTIDFTSDGFGGNLTTLLSDGRYQLQFDTTAIHVLNEPANLLRDDDGTVDGIRRENFHRLNGDFDGNATVALADRDLLVARFGARIGQPKYQRAFDLNEDGVINVADYMIWTKLLGKTV